MAGDEVVAGINDEPARHRRGGTGAHDTSRSAGCGHQGVLVGAPRAARSTTDRRRAAGARVPGHRRPLVPGAGADCPRHRRHRSGRRAPGTHRVVLGDRLRPAARLVAGPVAARPVLARQEAALPRRGARGRARPRVDDRCRGDRWHRYLDEPRGSPQLLVATDLPRHARRRGDGRDRDGVAPSGASIAARRSVADRPRDPLEHRARARPSRSARPPGS